MAKTDWRPAFVAETPSKNAALLDLGGRSQEGIVFRWRIQRCALQAWAVLGRGTCGPAGRPNFGRGRADFKLSSQEDSGGQHTRQQRFASQGECYLRCDNTERPARPRAMSPAHSRATTARAARHELRRAPSARRYAAYSQHRHWPLAWPENVGVSGAPQQKRYSQAVRMPRGAAQTGSTANISFRPCSGAPTRGQYWAGTPARGAGLHFLVALGPERDTRAARAP